MTLSEILIELNEIALSRAAYADNNTKCSKSLGITLWNDSIAVAVVDLKIDKCDKFFLRPGRANSRQILRNVKDSLEGNPTGVILFD